MAAVEHKPLTKRAALEYLERAGRPVTAKEVAIDLDSRASTASELLERCIGQGLLSRDPKQRPREYVLTDLGRERLKFFRSQENSGQQVLQRNNPARFAEQISVSNANPGPGGQGQSESPPLDDLKEEIRSQFEALRADVRDLFEALGIRPQRGQKSSDMLTRVRELANRLESLSKETASEEVEGEELASDAIVDLYRAQYELARLGFFDSEKPVKDHIAHLEDQVGPETAAEVKRLVSLERDSNEGRLRSILELRERLGLPAEIFGVSEEGAS